MDDSKLIRTAGRQTFSLDFDDTFTADPELWSFFVAKAQVLGHDVACISARYNDEGNLQELKRALPPGVTIVLCDGKPKRTVAEDVGLSVDVWIDDCPEAILPFDDRIESLKSECQRLRLLVQESREQRDMAEQKAKAELQAEMADLRKELARSNAMDSALSWPLPAEPHQSAGIATSKIIVR